MTLGLTQPVQRAGAVAQQKRQPDKGESARRGSAGIESGLPPTPIIGVVCSGDVAVYRDEVKTAIQRGLAQRPDAVWVCIEPKSDRITHDVMLSLDLEPVVLPMNAHWKTEGGDWRRVWRDCELMSLCDELIVFHKRSGHSPWRDRKKSGYHRNLYVVELGPEPKPKRKGRKSV